MINQRQPACTLLVSVERMSAAHVSVRAAWMPKVHGRAFSLYGLLLWSWLGGVIWPSVVRSFSVNVQPPPLPRTHGGQRKHACALEWHKVFWCCSLFGTPTPPGGSLLYDSRLFRPRPPAQRTCNLMQVNLRPPAAVLSVDLRWSRLFCIRIRNNLEQWAWWEVLLLFFIPSPTAATAAVAVAPSGSLPKTLIGCVVIVFWAKKV